MSELSEAINEMRNMRESYNQIGAAAEAYNTGKTELAANLTAKGVPASADETLPELAEKVPAIAQESYTIDGGEMYAKQLFGSLETPNYWNLYEVLANLLSDGRLVNYGGILLAEYYKGYDSLALSGAGAGGAYVVSDKDSQGNFIMYTNDTTHVWDTAFNGKGNRWVAYCFAGENHDFQITDTNTSPRSIFIGRKVGNIVMLANGRVSDIFVADGSELRGITGTYSFTNQWNKRVVLRNLKEIELANSRRMINNSNTEAAYVEIDSLNVTEGSYSLLYGSNLSCAIVKINNITASQSQSTYLVQGNNNTIAILEIPYAYWQTTRNCKETYFPILESAVSGSGSSAQPLTISPYVYLGYESNDRNKSVEAYLSGCTDIELKEGYCKNLKIATWGVTLDKNVIQSHVFDRLGVNDLSLGTITLQLYSLIYDLFTAEEIAAVTERTNITITRFTA